MRALSERWKPVILLLCLVLVALLFLTLRTRIIPQVSFVDGVVVSLVMPLQRLIDSGAQRLRHLWKVYIALRDVQQENIHLKRQMAELQGQLTHYKEAYLQQQRLRELLSFRSLAFPRMVAAEVVGIDPSQWSEAVTISKGSRDDVRKDTAVVTHQGLVGRTIDIAPHYATVLLVTDRRSAVDAIVQRSRVRGIVVGKSRRLCELRYVDVHTDIQVGDVILSSGLGEIYPKGLPIGTVVAIHNKPDGLFHDIEIQPAVDLARLEEVLVLIP